MHGTAFSVLEYMHIKVEKVKNRQFIPNQSHSTPSLELIPSNFRMNLISLKTGVFGLSVGEEIMIVRFDTISECDRQTDGRTDIQIVAIPALAELAMLPRW